jgi:predicted phosphodiesterase
MRETKTDFIKQFIIDNDFYQLPSRTLAKAVVTSNPEIFGKYNDKNIELARRIIREIRHSAGNRKAADSVLFAEKFHDFLDPDINDYSTFYIPKEVTRLGILNDIHFPYHHKENLKAAVEYLKGKEANGILLNGDVIDAYKSSSFMKDPRMRDLSEEFNILREFIDELNYTFNCPIYYKLGNHEERIENSILKQVPELVHFVTFENCLTDGGKFDLNEYNVTIIKDKRKIKFTDHLTILHGHEYRTGMFNPVGIARWLYMKARGNAACGHGHKKDSFAARNIDGKTIETNSIGCLCQMTPKYMPLNDWQAGFAYVRRTPDNYYKFSNLLIEEGKIL